MAGWNASLGAEWELSSKAVTVTKENSRIAEAADAVLILPKERAVVGTAPVRHRLVWHSV